MMDLVAYNSRTASIVLRQRLNRDSMHKKWPWWLTLIVKYALFLLFAGMSTVYATNYPVALGNTTVVIQRHQHGRGKVFVHLHQNEITALRAARAVIRSQGGSLLTLVHSGERNIVFSLHHKRYEFDPNRIFTDRGIKKTLLQFGHYSPAAHKEVKKLAHKIILLLPKGKIIAVHNNQSYSLKNYFPGHDAARDAQALNYNAKHHYRNFYLVTKEDDYQRLKKLNFNSIWQALNAQDDGSLSVYLAGSDYINVEAGYDQLAAQIQMLKHA